MRACKNCAANCTFIHGKKNDSSSSVGFFNKVIHNDKSLDTLFIPPKFAQRVVSLATKEVKIEDLYGRQWTVELHYVEGALAFGRGWSSFTLDHGINKDDMVLVRYIPGSHFVCEVFGTNACDKGAKSKNERCSITHGKGVKRKFFEDPCCILNRDIEPEPNRRCLFDLSELEMGNTKLDFMDRSSSVPFSNHAFREEHIYDSCYVESIIDLSAFEADMRIPCDDEINDSLIFGESYPSTSAGNATEHNMNHAGSSMDAKTASFQDSRFPAGVSPGPSVDAQAANFKAQTAPFQGSPLKTQTAAFPGQPTTLRDQQEAEEPPNPNGFGNERSQVGGNVRTDTNEPGGINPEGSGGSVRIPKEERNEFKPNGLGGSVRIAKEERNEFNPNGLGGNMGNVNIKRENKPTGFGGSTRIVKEELNRYGGNAGRVKKEQFSQMYSGPQTRSGGTRSAQIFKNEPMEAQTAAFQGVSAGVSAGPSVGAQTRSGGTKSAQMFKKEHIEAQTAAFQGVSAGPSVGAQTRSGGTKSAQIFKKEPMEAQTAAFQGVSAGPSVGAQTRSGGTKSIFKEPREAQTAAFQGVSAGPSVGAQTRSGGTSARIFKKEPMEAQTATFQGISAGPSVVTQTRSGGTRSARIFKNEHVEAQTASFQGQTTTINPMEAQTAAFQGQTTTIKPMEAQTAAFQGQTTTIKPMEAQRAAFQGVSAGPSLDAQTANLIAQTFQVPPLQAETAGFHGQKTIPRDQGTSHTLENARRVENEQFRQKFYGSQTHSGGAEIFKNNPLQFDPQLGVNTQNSNVSLREYAALISYPHLKTVKTEAVVTSPSSVPAVTCLVTSDINYLELPKEFSSLVYNMDAGDRKMVFLRDPAGRLWPFLLSKKKNVQVTAGWKSLRDANGVRIGDECVFTLEDLEHSTIKVNVVRKQDITQNLM